MSAEAIIETAGLRRTFKGKGGPVEAVAGVDLRVTAGDIFGFLGPNGAGKTTTLRILATLLPPTAGIGPPARRVGSGQEKRQRRVLCPAWRRYARASNRFPNFGLTPARGLKPRPPNRLRATVGAGIAATGIRREDDGFR